MHILYNFGMYVLRGFLALAALFNTKMRLRHHATALAFADLESKVDRQSTYVWFHAASLGEFEQGRPMIERLRRQQPHQKILLTFFSPSGYEVRKNYSEVDLVCYLPLDTPRNVSRFFAAISIEKAIFIKYEFWANYLLQLQSKNIPTYIISTIFRPSQVFFRFYGHFFLNLLSCFTTIFVQDENSKALLNQFGIKQVYIGDDTRFDRVSDIASMTKILPIAEAFATGAEVLVAGSSWQPDEDFLTRYVNVNKEKKLIIAPHEVSSERINELCSKLRCSFVCYTQTTPEEAANARCLVVDTIGVLSSLYRYGQVAYVGGGFGVGIHNTLEAAVWNTPVVFGPNYQRFREARDLIACGGAYSVTSYRQFEDCVNHLFFDRIAAEQAGIYVRSHVGATNLIMDKIFN